MLICYGYSLGVHAHNFLPLHHLFLFSSSSSFFWFFRGGQVDLSKPRFREKNSGRPPPWNGEKIRGNGRDVTARFGGNMYSGSRGRQGQNSLVLNEDRSSGAVLEKKRDLGKKSIE